MKYKALSLILGSILFFGCGSGGDTTQSPATSDDLDQNINSANNQDTSSLGTAGTTIRTAKGVYFDSAIDGVHYVCGSKSGTTGDSGKAGSFTYEIGKNCTFSINKMDLTAVSSDAFTGGEVVVKPNLDVARYLQSLDNDANAANGITISSAVVGALSVIESNSENGVIALPVKDSDVSDILNQLKSVQGFGGKFVSKKDANEHLVGYTIYLSSDKTKYRVGDRVILRADVTGNSDDMTYSWKKGTTAYAGNENELIIQNLKEGTHKIDLIVSKNGTNTTYSTNIVVGSVYSHNVTISPSTTLYNSDENVTLTANVIGNEDFTVTYLWKDGLNTIGLSKTITKQFTEGIHKITVEASANNYSKRASLTLTVSNPVVTNLIDK